MTDRTNRPQFTVQQLIDALQKIEDESMLVAINDKVVEATGLVQEVKVCPSIKECPYDKGDNVYAVHALDDNQPILILISTGVLGTYVR